MESSDLFDSVVEKYSRHLNPGLARLLTFAGFGVEDHAEGCYLYDHEGKRFLDCLGGYGVFSLGHRHPSVVAAVKRQLDRMPLSGKAFFSQPSAELAEKLAHISPEGLQYAFFCNSGAEAVEGAIKMAKGATGRPKIVAAHGGYHGKTLGALSATGREKFRKSFYPLLPEVEFVPYSDVPALRNAVDGRTACVILEPLQGEGGIHVPPTGYLSECRHICNRTGALLILDEVQTGLGRTGRMFGAERDGVSPDLMTLAKALGGGVMPIGAVLGTPDVWEKVFGENPLVHTSTFGGNPLACAAALETLHVLEDEGLVENARVMGALFLERLQELSTLNADLVLEARGEGLMLGIEMREDEVGELVVAQLLQRGVCVAYTLNNPRVLRIEPPLILQEPHIDEALAAFNGAMQETREVLALVG